MVNGNGAETRWLVPLRRESGLATNALVRESLHESLRVQVLVPEGGKAFVFAVKLGVKGIHAVTNEAAPLLDTCVIVAVVEGRQMRASRQAKLETHLRVAHGIAVL